MVESDNGETWMRREKIPVDGRGTHQK